MSASRSGRCARAPAPGATGRPASAGGCRRATCAWASTPARRTPPPPHQGQVTVLGSPPRFEITCRCRGRAYTPAAHGTPPPDPRCRRRLVRQPRRARLAFRAMKRPAGWLTLGRAGADHRRRGAAAPDPHRPGAARPVLRRGRPEHGAVLAQLLLRRVRARRQRLDRQAARRPVAAGRERQAARLLRRRR